MAKMTDAPKGVDVMGMRMNVAVVLDAPDADPAPQRVLYNAETDNGLASLRSKHEVKPAADRGPIATSDLPLGMGLSLRMAMAGQAENNQFPYRTDEYGKMRD